MGRSNSITSGSYHIWTLLDAFQNYFSADLFADLFQNLMMHQQIVVIKEVKLDCNI